jgi:hypothetical protein
MPMKIGFKDANENWTLDEYGVPMGIGLWVKAISLLLEALENSKHKYYARSMNDMLRHAIMNSVLCFVLMLD